jgi:lysozyme family protein
MADINLSMPFLIRHEGTKETNTLNDHGGDTKMGVTQRNLDAFNEQHPEYGLPACVGELTLDNATTFYHYGGFWQYDGLAVQNVATKVFDLGVLCGDGTEVKMLQGILGVSTDGHYGPQTERATNAADPGHVITMLCMMAEAHFKAIVAHDPTQQEFLNDWLGRALDTNF